MQLYVIALGTYIEATGRCVSGRRGRDRRRGLQSFDRALASHRHSDIALLQNVPRPQAMTRFSILTLYVRQTCWPGEPCASCQGSRAARAVRTPGRAKARVMAPGYQEKVQYWRHCIAQGPFGEMFAWLPQTWTANYELVMTIPPGGA